MEKHFLLANDALKNHIQTNEEINVDKKEEFLKAIEPKLNQKRPESRLNRKIDTNSKIEMTDDLNCDISLKLDIKTQFSCFAEVKPKSNLTQKYEENDMYEIIKNFANKEKSDKLVDYYNQQLSAHEKTKFFAV